MSRKKKRSSPPKKKAGKKQQGRKPRRPAEQLPGFAAALPLPAEKLSDALLKVARPILSRPEMPEDPEAMRGVLLIAALVWNAARAPTAAEARAVLQDVNEALTLEMGFPPDAAAEMIGLLERRVRNLYPHDPRWVYDVRVEEEEAGYRVQALSVLEPPPHVLPPRPRSEPEPRGGLVARAWARLTGARRGGVCPPAGGG